MGCELCCGLQTGLFHLKLSCMNDGSGECRGGTLNALFMFYNLINIYRKVLSFQFGAVYSHYSGPVVSCDRFGSSKSVQDNSTSTEYPWYTVLERAFVKPHDRFKVLPMNCTGTIDGCLL